MNTRVYSIFDVKSVSYGPPFCSHNDQTAIRSLREMVMDPNTSIGRFPADFKLYMIGSFDTDKGYLAGVDPVVHVLDAVALVPPPAAPLPFEFHEQKKAAE